MKTRDIDSARYVEILTRIYKITGTKTQVELAEFLGVRQSAISDAKRRGSIPAKWLLTIWDKKKVSPDWVLTGEGGESLLSLGRAIVQEIGMIEKKTA